MWPCRLCGLLLILQGVGRLVLSFPVEKMGKYQKDTKCLHYSRLLDLKSLCV